MSESRDVERRGAPDRHCIWCCLTPLIAAHRPCGRCLLISLEISKHELNMSKPSIFRNWSWLLEVACPLLTTYLNLAESEDADLETTIPLLQGELEIVQADLRRVRRVLMNQ